MTNIHNIFIIWTIFLFDSISGIKYFDRHRLDKDYQRTQGNTKYVLFICLPGAIQIFD